MLEDTDDRFDRLARLADRLLPRAIDLAERVCRIPAPTGQEAERARFVADALAARGLAVEVDDLGDVIARRPGRGARPTLMLAAHTDTVFPEGTPIAVERADGRLTGPGIGDNSLGVAGLVTLVDLLEEAGVETPGDLLLVANVGEEGLGNLRGIRAVVDRYEAELGGVVAVEGHNLGRVTNVAVGSRRLRVTVETEGGHSWGAFGAPSAIHELATIVAGIAQLRVPATPKTTYNVGLIDGGVSVNTIAPSASAVIDLRSTDPQALARLADQVERIILSRRSDRVRVAIDVLGERPAGATPESARIVREAVAILGRLGIRAELNASSTDANVPIARGIPAICVGLTFGANAHRTDETIEIAPVARGLLQLALLVSSFPVGARAAGCS